MRTSAPVRAVADASVVISSLLDEELTEQALSLLGSIREILVPELLFYETVSAFAKQVRLRMLDPEEAESKRQIVACLPVTSVPPRETDALALALSLKTGHSAYDCFYLALAIAEECPLVTGDRRLAQSAEDAGFGEYVLLLVASR